MTRLRAMFIVAPTVAAATLVSAMPAHAAPTSSGPPAAGAATAGAGRAGVQLVGGSNDFFNGNSCTSASFCIAVGSYTLNGHSPGLSEMLTGGTWVAETVPSPAQGVNVFGNEVSCASPTRCLFVGDHWAAGHANAPMNLAEAWNGSAWRIITAAGPRGTGFSALYDVSCPTANFCLAVGAAGTGNHGQATAYTWRNGTSWRPLAVPHPRGARNSYLSGLGCSSASNCMAAANYTSAAGKFLPYAARWHNGRWQLMAMPAIRGQRDIFMNGVSCPTATKCVAVGFTEDNTRNQFFHALAEVWGRRGWQVSTLRSAPSQFLGTSCPAWNRCFATGYTYPSVTGYAHQLIESWNGRSWTTQHPAETTGLGGIVQHVSCVSTSHCEAVGFTFTPGVNNSDQTLAEVWNGHGWTIQPTVNP